MHACTNRPGCPGCSAEAAKAISDWGCYGVQSAAKIVGEGVAQGMLQAHVQRNVSEMYPGLSVHGDENGEEMKKKIKDHRRAQREAALTNEELVEVRRARAMLHKHGLFDE